MKKRIPDPCFRHYPWNAGHSSCKNDNCCCQPGRPYGSLSGPHRCLFQFVFQVSNLLFQISYFTFEICYFKLVICYFKLHVVISYNKFLKKLDIYMFFLAEIVERKMTDVHVSSRKTREDRQTNLELLRVKICFPSKWRGHY